MQPVANPSWLTRVTDAFAWPLRTSHYLELVNPLWTTHALQARVEKVWDETADARTITLRPGRNWRSHRPGQHLRIGVPIGGMHSSIRNINCIWCSHANPAQRLARFHVADIIEEFGREMDAIRNEVMDSRGDRDRAYILRIIRWPRSLALLGRIVMFLSLLMLPASGLPYAGWPQFITALALGQRCSASPRSSRTWRSATTSCTRGGIGCVIPTSRAIPGNGTTSVRPISGSIATTSSIALGQT